MRKLLKYMKGYGKECVAGPLFKLFEAVLELFVPLIVAAIIDLGIGGEDSGYIVRMSLLLVALGALGFAFSATAQFFAARAAVGFAARLREALIAHVGKMSYSDLDRAGTSSLVTLVTNDVNQVQSGVNLTLRLLLRSPFIVFGAMIMAFFIDVPSAMIFVVIIPVLSIVVMGIMLACVPIYRRAQSKLEAVLGKTRENLTGARVIRAFCREEVEIADFDAKNSSLTAVQKLAGRISALMNPITFVLVNAAAIILIRTDAIRVESGVLTQGEVVALYNYMTQILVELIKMASLVISLAKSIAGANRIAAELDVPIGEGVPGRFKPTEDIFSEGKNADPAAYAVEFRAASLRYPGASAASLTGVTIAVGRGETVGIIGGTGSGKTTLVNMIGRFYDATGGEVLVGGVNVRDYHPADLRERIGIVPQRAALLSGSLRENLRLGKKDAQDEEIMTAARAACAAEVIEGKGGLDYIIEEEGRNLSGGQRQRLTIARALVKKPEILILDDSSSALDYATDAALRRSLAALPWRPAVFIVSQRASSVRHADKIIVLDDGVVAGIGTDGELLESCRVYREICESQNEGGTPGDEE